MNEAVIIKSLSVIHQNCDTQTELLPFLLGAVLHCTGNEFGLQDTYIFYSLRCCNTKPSKSNRDGMLFGA